MTPTPRSQVSPGDKKKRTRETDNSSNGKRLKKCSIEVNLENEEEAIAELQDNFGLSKEYSAALWKLGKSLKVDDPGVFLTFRSGVEVNRALQSRMGAELPIVTQGRPGAPDANGNVALQNVKDWVLGQLPRGKQALEVGDRAFAIGNLTQDEYNALTLTLGFSTKPGKVWGLAALFNDYSLGGILGVTGTGIGQATFAQLSSIGFSDQMATRP
jgi:hypothetical protein